MKKYIALVAALIMVVAVFAACGKNDTTDETTAAPEITTVKETATEGGIETTEAEATEAAADETTVAEGETEAAEAEAETAAEEETTVEG